MTHPPRSQSPSGTFGRRSQSRLRLDSSSDSALVSSETSRSKQRRIDPVDEQKQQQATTSTAWNPANVQDAPRQDNTGNTHPVNDESGDYSHPSSQSHLHTPSSDHQYSSSPRSRTPVHESSDGPRSSDTAPTTKRYGIGEKGGAESIKPLTRTISPEILAQRKQDAERARLWEQHIEEEARRARANGVGTSSPTTIRPFPGSTRDSRHSADSWRPSVNASGTPIPNMDNPRDSHRRSALSDASLPGSFTYTNLQSNRRNSLRFITPSEYPLNPDHPRFPEASILKSSNQDTQRGRVRSVPADAFRHRRRSSEGRRSFSPVAANRKRHQSLHGFDFHLPLPSPLALTPIGLRSFGELEPRNVSSLGANESALHSRSWRPSAATHFSGHQDLDDYIATRRKTSDAYSAAALALEPRLPKQAVRSSDDDPVISNTLSQSLALSFQRALVPLRLVLPFLISVFFDFNALFILAELAEYADQPVPGGSNRTLAAWWVAFGVYIFCSLLHVLLFAYLVIKAYRTQTDPLRALAVPSYLSLYGRLLMIMRKSSLHHFVRTVDREARRWQRFTESAWRWRQAWPLEITQVPRLIITIIYVIIYGPGGADLVTPRDPFYFDSTGSLSRYAYAVSLANIGWTSLNILVVLLAALWVRAAKNGRSKPTSEESVDWEGDSERLAPYQSPEGHAWQQNTRDRICVALLKLESATSLDPMVRLPVHSTHGRGSYLGKGASLSGTALGASNYMIPQDLPRSSGPMQSDAPDTPHSQPLDKMVTIPAPQSPETNDPQAWRLTLPTVDSLRASGARFEAEPSIDANPVPFPVEAARNSDESERPSRSYLTHPLATEGGASRDTTAADPLPEIHAIAATPVSVRPESTSFEEPTELATVQTRETDPGLSDISIEPQVVSPNESAPSPAKERKSFGFLRLQRRSDSERNQSTVKDGPATETPAPANEATAVATPTEEESGHFWSGWFGSRGRGRRGSATKSGVEASARSPAAVDDRKDTSGASGEEQGKSRDSAEPTRKTVGFHALERRSGSDSARQETEGNEPGNALGASATGPINDSSEQSSQSSDDSEERRLWEGFPDQSRRHPPGLIALELQERALQEEQRGARRLSSEGVSRVDGSGDSMSGASGSLESQGRDGDSDGLYAEGEGLHNMLIYARSPSEGGLMAITEESSNFGDGASITNRSHCSGGTGTGTASREHSMVGSNGNPPSTSNSAGSGLAAVREGESGRGE